MVARRMAVALALASCVSMATADLYMHSVRGANNRVNEQNVNRNNNNRLWDSQNNNKGGYSIGVDDDDYEVIPSSRVHARASDCQRSNVHALRRSCPVPPPSGHPPPAIVYLVQLCNCIY